MVGIKHFILGNSEKDLSKNDCFPIAQMQKLRFWDDTQHSKSPTW